MRTTAETLDIETLTPNQAEMETAAKLSRTLTRQIAKGETPVIILSGDESGTQTVLPKMVARLLVKILSEIAKGNAVTIVPVKAELTIREAAELLNISLHHMINLLERSQMPSHKVGTGRRIRLADLLAYKRKDVEERKAILDEMVALNQEMGLYD